MVLGDYVSERKNYKLVGIDYHEESGEQGRDRAIVNVLGRDSNGNKDILEVYGFHPYFYVTCDEFENEVHDTVNESLVRRIEIPESMDERIDGEYLASDKVERLSEKRETLHNEKVVKIYTNLPKHVGELREEYETDKEADVFFEDRFLIDNDIYTGFSAPTGETRVHVDDIEALSEEETPDVKPRIVSFDLEVASPDGFPEPSDAAQKITAISAHDSYSDTYKQWVLQHPSWDEVPSWETPADVGDVEVRVFENDEEQEMVEDFQIWTANRRPDILTGWNAAENDNGNGFDIPYLINRSFNINAWSMYDVCPLDGPAEDVYVTRKGRAEISGLAVFDMLQAYKKTQVHELDNASLDHVAEKELDYGKVDMPDIDDAWENDPVRFVKYSIRDTQAVVEIEQKQEILEMYDHVRTIAGTQYQETHYDFSIIDSVFLREARDNGYVLPTSEKPERDWYYGAKVFETTPGKHENVVYPDLKSLYPFIMWSLNISPETMFETLEEAKEAGYSEDQLYTGYIDRRDDEEKKNSEPERTKIYYVKSDEKEGFVTSLVDDLTDMKYVYDGTPKYGAVKRTTNALYGVFGDSSSFGDGFRLFDWQLAETVTLAGQDILKFTADEFVGHLNRNGYPNANLIGGDTDSVQTAIPSADGMEESLEASKAAVEYTNEQYDEFMSERFNIERPEQHRTKVELESYATACFFLQESNQVMYPGFEEERDGVKKKYSQLIVWDEGEVIEDPEPKSKGFQLVRSDSAQITKEAQKKVLHMILKEDDPKKAVMDYLENTWTSVIDGNVDLEDIGTPSKIGNPLWEYGWSQDENTGEVNYYTPQPHIRGARYANAFVENEDMGEGSKPLMFYCDGVAPTSELPETYCYENKMDAPDGRNIMKEEDRVVDAIAVENTVNVPEGIRVDYDKMAEKTLKGPIEPITTTMGWSWDDVTTGTEQADLTAF